MKQSILDLYDSINFKRIHPDTRLNMRLTYSVILQMLGRYGMSFELWNTRLDTHSPATDLEIKKLCGIPKASTYAIGTLIQRIVNRMNADEIFLNIGTWHGFTYLSGLVGNENKRCIAVDNFCVHRKIDSDGAPQYNGVKKKFYKKIDDWTRRSFQRHFTRYKSDNHFFYEMDYVEYLKHHHNGKIGFYIYDAQHRYRDQYQALLLAEKYFSETCVILIDDINDQDNYRATLDFINESQNNYQILIDQKTTSNRHPTFWNGVMVFQRHSRE